MCYRIKTAFMKRIIAKKQKKGFDYDAAESFALKSSDDETVNNSYYFSAHGAESGESLYVRLGLRNGRSEVWFYYSDGNKKYIAEENLYTQDCPLSVFKDGEVWRIKYSGKVACPDGGTHSAEFSGEFSGQADAVDFFTHMPPVRTAKAMAAEKWSKSFFAEVQSNNQVHYEQAGTLKFSLKAGADEVNGELPCLRDHSFGKRDWNYMNNHLWLACVNGNSQLNFSMVSYPAMTMLEVGNFKRGDEPQAFVLSADYDRAVAASGAVPDEFKVRLTLANGDTLDVTAEKRDETRYEFQSGAYVLTEGVADFDINGEKFRGIVEIGLNSDCGRRYNGRDIKKLRS